MIIRVDYEKVGEEGRFYCGLMLTVTNCSLCGEVNWKNQLAFIVLEISILALVWVAIGD